MSRWRAFEHTHKPTLDAIQAKTIAASKGINSQTETFLPVGYDFRLRLCEVPFQNTAAQYARLVSGFDNPRFKQLLNITTINLPCEQGYDPVHFSDLDDFFVALLSLPDPRLDIDGTPTSLRQILDSDARLDHPQSEFLRFIADMYAYSTYFISDEANIGTQFEGVQFLNALCVARPDDLIFSCKSDDHASQKLLKSLSSVVAGDYFGRRQLMDISELTGDSDNYHLIPDDNPPLRIFRELLERIDRHEIKMTLVEKKTNTAQYLRVNGHLKKVVFHPDKVSRNHLRDISHTLEAFRSFISVATRASHLRHTLLRDTPPLDPHHLAFNYDPNLLSDHLRQLSSAHVEESGFRVWQDLVSKMDIVLVRFFWPIVDANNLIDPQVVADDTLPQTDVRRVDSEQLKSTLINTPKIIVSKILSQS